MLKGMFMAQQKTDIKSLSFTELKAFLTAQGQPAFRTKQIFDWLHAKQVVSFDQMTNLPKTLAAKLAQEAVITAHAVEKKLVSKIDGTVKYLFRLPDGEFCESVVMEYKHGKSICISTQVGCRMGCSFCASTKAGFVRHMTPSEILEQVYAAQRDLGCRIGHIVLMGIGEPLDNYDNVLRFLSLISDERGNNLSLRHVSLSTCGLVDRIDRLAKEHLGLTLSVSLHAPNDAIRGETMPVSKKWPMEALLAACSRYAEETGRRVSFEYALIRDLNDSMACADELAKKLSGMLCHVNLIPVNEIKETAYQKSEKARILAFQQRLIKHGINATVRRTLGADISAACGQLRREQLL